MMKLQDFASGITVYVDPLAVQGVLPAVPPPPAGILPAQYIPKVVGSQLLIAGCAPLVVRGMPVDIAKEVADEKDIARRIPPTN